MNSIVNAERVRLGLQGIATFADEHRRYVTSGSATERREQRVLVFVARDRANAADDVMIWVRRVRQVRRVRRV